MTRVKDYVFLDKNTKKEKIKKRKMVRKELNYF
jgi:hypothetical protein